MQTNNMKFALILNPKDGDFKHTTINFDTWSQNPNLVNKKNSWIPSLSHSIAFFFLPIHRSTPISSDLFIIPKAIRFVTVG